MGIQIELFQPVLQLIDISTEIGGISRSNGQYTAGLMRRIQETRKNIEDLTVGELLKLNHEHKKWFNELYL